MTRTWDYMYRDGVTRKTLNMETFIGLYYMLYMCYTGYNKQCFVLCIDMIILTCVRMCLPFRGLVLQANSVSSHIRQLLHSRKFLNHQ